MADFPVPDSVGQLQELFEIVVSWADPALVNDDEARHRLVLAGYQLGAQRAEALGRGMRAIDVEYGLAFLCKWPLKPEASATLRDQIDEVRERIIPAASEGQWVDVDPTVLTPSLDELYDRLQAEGPSFAAE